MAKARFDIPAQLPSGVTRPLYAGLGATDRVVAVVRDAVADFSKRASSVRDEVVAFDYEPQALRRQATQVVTAGVAGLQSEAKDIPVRFTKLVDDQVAVAGDAFGEFVKRGETLVGRIRRQSSTTETVSAAKTTTAKARTTRTQATKTARSTATKTASTAKRTARKSPAASSAKATSTSAKKTASSAARATKDAAKKIGD
jgi:cobalamin biosynthesis Mg chelatase CobN